MQPQTLIDLGKLKRMRGREGGETLNVSALANDKTLFRRAIGDLCRSQDEEIRKIAKDIASREGFVPQAASHSLAEKEEIPEDSGPGYAKSGKKMTLEEGIQELIALVFSNTPEGPLKDAFIKRIEAIQSPEGLKECLRKSGGGLLIMCGKARAEAISEQAQEILRKIG